MKDVMMLLGFSMGLVTGALLYKYSTSAKQMVDKSEKAVMKEVEKATNKVKKAQKKAEIKLSGQEAQDLKKSCLFICCANKNMPKRA